MQSSRGIPVKGVTDNRTLKLRLTNSFGDRICFFQEKKGTTELAYSDAAPVKEDDQSSMFLVTDVEKVKQTATMIRNEFNEINPFTSWPAPAEEIKADNIIIPELLETFLKSVLTKDNSTFFRVWNE